MTTTTPANAPEVKSGLVLPPITRVLTLHIGSKILTLPAKTEAKKLVELLELLSESVELDSTYALANSVGLIHYPTEQAGITIGIAHLRIAKNHDEARAIADIPHKSAPFPSDN